MKIITLYDNPLSKKEISALLQKKEQIFFFINQNERLFEYIDKLQLDNKDDFYFKVLREIHFEFNVILKDKLGRVIKNHFPSLSSLFKEIDLDNISNYKVVLDVEDKDVLSDLIQQFIYADIVVDVTLKIEEDRRRIVNEFIANSSKIVLQTRKLLKDIEEIPEPGSKGVALEVKDIILENLSETPEIVESTQDRPIRVALLGPRRNGKSEIANCILGDNYVPTTSELITPTNCIYEKSPDGKLRVIIEQTDKITGVNPVIYETDSYETNSVEFDTVDELRKYLHELFMKDDLQLDSSKGFSIPEIKIHYNPTKDSGIPNVVLIDTPGPNIAGTKEHKKLAYRWLRDADVILFVIELQYARNQENVSFIEDVQKDIFREKGKNYSLIFAGNKSDLRFSAGEKPSLIRTLDRFKTELYSLSLDGFVSIATSALTYNGVTKVTRDYHTENDDSLSSDSSDDFQDLLRFHRKKYKGGQNDYMLSAGMIIRNQADALELYYDQEPHINMLKKMSGIDTLIRFTKYIADEKALFEVINYAIIRLQEIFSIIETNLLAKNILAFEGDKNKVINLLKDYRAFVENARRTELPKMELSSLDGIVEERLGILEDILLEELISRFLIYMRQLDGSTSQSKEELITKIVTEYSEFTSTAVNNHYKDVTGQINVKLQTEVRKKETLFTTLYSKIKNKFDNLNTALKKQSLDLDKFSFPSASNFSPPTLSIDIDTQDSLELYLRSNIVDRAKGGFFHRIAKWIDNNIFDGQQVVQGLLKDLLEEVFGDEVARSILRRGEDWSVYYEDVKRSELGLVFRKQARELSNYVLKACNNELKGWQRETNKRMDHAVKFIEDQIDRLISFIEAEHYNVESQIHYLEEIRENFDTFLSNPEIDMIYKIKD